MKSRASLFGVVALVLTAPILLNGCSVLIGQVKPVEQKAPPSPMAPVDQLDPEWTRLSMEATSPGAEDIPDASWQSKKTAAVISINSACRQNVDDEGDLRSITQNLLSAWRSLKIESEQEIIVSNHTGLETTAQGFYLSKTRKFQVIVVKTPTCIYDLIYLSPPPTFKQDLSLFHRFRDSLNLK